MDKKYRELFEALSEIVYEIDLDGNFTYVSNTVRMLGYDPDELIGQHFTSILHPEDAERVSREKVLPKYKGTITGDANSPKLFDERRTGKRMTKHLNVRLLKKDAAEGETKTFLSEVSSSGDYEVDSSGETKKMIGSIGVINNVAEELDEEGDLRKQIRELQSANSLKSQFVAHVAHELKGPLGIIKESIQLLLDGTVGKVDKKQRLVLEIGHRTINRLARLVSDLLEVSKIEAGRFQLKRTRVPIDTLLDEVLDVYRHQISKKRQHLDKERLGEIDYVWADHDRLYEVIVNLLNNAIKYTPEGGRIKIKVIGSALEVRFEISDTGPGIPQKYYGKVFDKFERVNSDKQEGTGLGLPIAKDIVELHKGKIWVESEIGRGSTFIVVLPKDLRGSSRFRVGDFHGFRSP